MIRVYFDAKAKRFGLRDESRRIEDADDYLESLLLRGLSLHTNRSYAYDLAILYRWMKETNLTLRALTEADLLRLVERQVRRGAQPRSVNRLLSTTRLFFRFITGDDAPMGERAAREGPHFRGTGRDRVLGLQRQRVRRRPAVRVKVPRKLIEPLSREQVSAFLETLRRYRDLAVVYLMLFCGLRSAEVRGIRLHDIDFVEHRLRVRGKGSKERQMPMPGVLAKTISDYLRLERPPRASSDYLLLVLQGRRRGEPMTSAGLRQLFRHRRRRQSLAPAHAHRWRHTFATDMARAGVRLPVLQKMMGHAHAETTLQYVNLAMVDVASEYERAMKRLASRYEN